VDIPQTLSAGSRGDRLIACVAGVLEQHPAAYNPCPVPRTGSAGGRWQLSTRPAGIGMVVLAIPQAVPATDLALLGAFIGAVVAGGVVVLIALSRRARSRRW
jgi:hypothetical protein